MSSRSLDVTAYPSNQLDFDKLLAQFNQMGYHLPYELH